MIHHLSCVVVDLLFAETSCTCVVQSNLILLTHSLEYHTTLYNLGNYSHIPNHILKCSACPPEVKAALKQAHQTLKHSLPKGSQKEFFNSVWERLHGNAAIPTTTTSTTAQVSFAAAPAPASGNYGGEDLPPPLPALPSLPALPPMDYEQL